MRRRTRRRGRSLRSCLLGAVVLCVVCLGWLHARALPAPAPSPAATATAARPAATATAAAANPARAHPERRGGFRPAPGEAEVHVVFSTDCSGYQHWQSIALWHLSGVFSSLPRPPVSRMHG